MTAATLARRRAAGIVLPGRPESVREARALVRRAMGRRHPAADAAAVCVSELAANAIAYTHSGLPGGTFAVTVRSRPGEVLIQVVDQGTRGFRGRPGRAAGEHGRGLQIVAALSEMCGDEVVPGGHAAWCRIQVRQAAAPHDRRQS